MIRFLFFSMLTTVCLVQGAFGAGTNKVYFLNHLNNETTYYVENILDNKINHIDIGIFKIVTLNKDESIDGKFSKVYGKSFKLNLTKLNLTKLKNQYRYNEVFTEKVNNTTNIYGYSPLIKDFQLINNKKINIQVSTNLENIIVGIPIILGSY